VNKAKKTPETCSPLRGGEEKARGLRDYPIRPISRHNSYTVKKKDVKGGDVTLVGNQ